jgi:tetratricopeptide (TPR) repeat protein
MDPINWQEVLGWGKDQLLDLRWAGYAYLRQGKYDVARSFFEALIVLDPKNAYDRQTLGALYLQIGDTMRALDTLKIALEINPTHLPSQINQAKGLLMMGNLPEGLALAKKLQKSSNTHVANLATALVLAYS